MQWNKSVFYIIARVLGAELNSIIEIITVSYEVLIQKLPFETDAVQSAAEVMKAIGRTCTPTRINFVLSSPPSVLLLQSYRYLAANERVLVTNLAPQGMALVTEAFSIMIVKSGQTDLFRMVSK